MSKKDDSVGDVQVFMHIGGEIIRIDMRAVHYAPARARRRGRKVADVIDMTAWRLARGR